MLFDRLGADWRVYKDTLSQLHALVVDDEPVITTVLEDLLGDEGFAVDAAFDAEAGWRLIKSNAYDLLVTDKNLPGMSGLDLIALIRQENLDLPTVMITGYASAESVSEALKHGAADYIQKPFPDIRHVVRRLKSVVDQRVADKFYSRIASDLTTAMATTGEDKDQIQELARELFAFKKRLSERPSVLLVEPGDAELTMASAALNSCGITAELCRNLDEAAERLSKPGGPLTAVINLHLPKATDFVAEARRWDPLLEVLITSAKADLGLSLKALAAGAVDFVNRSAEGMDVWKVRVSRLVDRARRQRLQVHLITSLYRRVKQQNHPVAQTLLETLTPQQRSYLEMATEPPPELPIEIEIDLSDLLEEVDEAAAQPSGSDRRSQPRVPADLRVRFQPLDPQDGQTLDISEGGMFVISDQTLKVGSRVRVEIFDPNGSLVQPVIAEGEIVRHVMVAPDPSVKTGFGVRILGDDQGDYEDLVSQLRRANQPDAGV